MILRFILFSLALYFIYKVVFELIVPIFRTTQKIRQQFGAMQQHMHDQANTGATGPSYQQKATAAEPKKPGRAGDYIDFEEIK